MSLSPYALAHLIRDRWPNTWYALERSSASLFRVLYYRKLRRIEPAAMQLAEPYRMQRISQIPTDQLVAFFRTQPEDTYQWFTPHGFTHKDIARLQRNPAFLGYVLKHNDRIVGYFFLRCFCNGACYFGRIVDYPYRNQGIGTLINRLSFYISEELQLKSYQTIAAENIASIKSCVKVYRLQPIGTTENGDTLYQNCKLEQINV